MARRRPTSPLLEAIAELAGFPVGGGGRSHRGVVDAQVLGQGSSDAGRPFPPNAANHPLELDPSPDEHDDVLARELRG